MRADYIPRYRRASASEGQTLAWFHGTLPGPSTRARHRLKGARSCHRAGWGGAGQLFSETFLVYSKVVALVQKHSTLFLKVCFASLSGRLSLGFCTESVPLSLSKSHDRGE